MSSVETTTPMLSSPGYKPSGAVRETAANLLLGRALQMLDGACGIVVFRDVEGRWQTDRFVLPQRMDQLDALAPLLEALVEWTLYTERPVVVQDLSRSRWARHLLHGTPPPDGSIAASPVAQSGTIWGAVAVYRSLTIGESMEVLGQLAEVATEPLSALAVGRPEGIPQNA